MAIKITVRQGGGVGASTLDVTAQSRVLDEEFSAGHMCGNGSACQFVFTVDDDPNDIPEYGVKAFAAHNVVTISEDAPGSDIWLARGRVANTETMLGDLAVPDAVSHKITVDDGNVDLRGIVLSADWVRSTETGAARAIALIEAYCQTDPRLTTDIDTHLVDAPSSNSLDDYTYPAGTPVTEVLDDIVSQDGKMYGVVIHHDGGSHLCLLYTGETNHSTYPCTLSITDTAPDLSTEFPPIWDQGAAVHRDGQGVISGVFSKYGMGGDSFVTSEDTALEAIYDYWWITQNDTSANTEARAQQRADNLVLYRGQEHITHQVTVKVPADKVHLLCAGMSIDMRSAASAGGENLGTTITRRITTLKWEPIAPEVGAVVGHYYAHMELDRPLRVLPERKTMGPKAPTEGTPGTPPTVSSSGGEGNNDDSLGSVTVSGAAEGLVAVAVTHEGQATPTVTWKPDNTNGALDQAMTIIGSVTHPTASSGSNKDGEKLWVAWLSNPTASTANDPGIVWDGVDGNANYGVLFGYWAVSSGTQPTVVGDYGTGSQSSVTAGSAGDLVLDCAGYRVWSLGDASNTPVPQSGQDTDWAVRYNNSAGQNDGSWFGGNSTGAGARAVNLGLPTNWVAAAIVFSGGGTAGDTTSPIGGEGDADTGDPDKYAGLLHVHEHGDRSADEGETNHHARQSEFTPTVDVLSTNVQDAIAEVGSDLADAIEDLSAEIADISLWNEPVVAALSNPPTQAELEAAIGENADTNAGQFWPVADSSNGYPYVVTSNGTRYWYIPFIASVGDPAGGAGGGGGGGDTGGTAYTLSDSPYGGWEQSKVIARAYNGETIWTYIRGDNGDIGVLVRKHSDGTTTSALIGAAYEVDDHASPDVLVRESDRRVIVVSSKHNGTNITQKISNTGGTSLTTSIASGFSYTLLASQLGTTEHTYPNIIQLTGETNDPLYLFFRADGGGVGHASQTWDWSKSTNGGGSGVTPTWSTKETYLQIAGRAPYPIMRQTSTTRIDFLVADGHWGTDADIDIYHMYYNGAAQTWHKTDGTSVTLPLARGKMTQVWDGTGGPGARAQDVILSGGNPWVVFIKKVGAGDFRYMFSRWNGSAWTTAVEIDDDAYYPSTSDNSTGGITFDRSDPNTVYYSKAVSGVMEMFTAVTADSGATWTPTAITSGSSDDQFHPVSPYDHESELSVLWLNGDRDDYTDWLAGSEGY